MSKKDLHKYIYTSAAGSTAASFTASAVTQAPSLTRIRKRLSDLLVQLLKEGGSKEDIELLKEHINRINKHLCKYKFT